jgi:imidazole glycerol-phosphate synthase subunit HisH
VARVSAESSAEGAGPQVVVTMDPAAVAVADAVVLPGVGAAGATMRHLERHGLIGPVREAAQGERPFLGVCLGLQLLFEAHEEDDAPGLGVLPGRARRLPGGLKVPHMGWNTVRPTPAATPLLAAATPQDGSPLDGDPYFYFVHSYYVEPASELAGAVAGTTAYGLRFCSLLAYRNIWATQFHPEKSGANGLRLLANFVREVAA